MGKRIHRDKAEVIVLRPDCAREAYVVVPQQGEAFERQLPPGDRVLIVGAPRSAMGHEAPLFRLFGLALALFLVGCATALARPPSTPTPGPNVADVLAHPPRAGISAELDAYFSGAGGPSLPGDASAPANIACPNLWTSVLTDRPFPRYLSILNGSHSNSLPEDAPWLIAIASDATHTDAAGALQLPYHGRFRGHFGEPVFTRCARADRIFVVDAVVATYQEKPNTPSAYPIQLPDGYANWRLYHDPRFGYSVAHPSDWTVAPLAESDVLEAVAFRAPANPDAPVVVRVHDGETHYDQYAPRSASSLLEIGVGGGFGVFQQGMPFRGQIATAGLAGYEVDRQPSPTAREVAILFSAGGRTYDVAVRYPLGFDASQPLLTAYSAIVEGFRLDAQQGRTPTPPVKQTLGAGPFLSQDQTLARVREQSGPDIQLLASLLVSEAEARRQAEACATFISHPDGVWLLTVRGTFERQTRTMRMALDAATGEQLCGEETNLSTTPGSTLPPGTTATPVRSADLRGSGCGYRPDCEDLNGSR